MKVSLNEAAGMATKAAWGAGRPWGLAQEAGNAVSALEAMRLPGAASLFNLLAATDRLPCERLRPITTGNGNWASENSLCPLLTGAYIADAGGEEFAAELDAVYAPLLLLPFARLHCAGVQISWDNALILANRTEASVEGNGLSDTVARAVQIAPLASSALDASKITHSSCWGPVDIADEIWEALSAFAHRTYVPATEASRLKGAGAGLTDND